MYKSDLLYDIAYTLCNGGNIDNLLNIPEIDSKRRYWVIRSESGKFWSDYKNNSFVAIGHNNYTYKMICNAYKNNTLDELKKIIENKEGVKKPKIIINQIKKFYDDIKVGDVVITPSKNSNTISFGIITSDAYEGNIDINAELDDSVCNYYKRRNVQWVVDVPYNKLDPYLYKLFCAHQAIFNATGYSKYIDRTMYPFFIKNNLVHLRVDVNTKNNISTRDLSDLLNLCSSEYLNYNTNVEISTKIAVQSPGLIEFISDKFNITSLLTLLSCKTITFTAFMGGLALVTKSIKDAQDIVKNYQEIKINKQEIKSHTNEEKRKQELHELEIQAKKDEEKRKQELHELEIKFKNINFIKNNLSLEKVNETAEILDLSIPNIADYTNKKEQN